MNSQQAIGIFDSGIGGLTVARAIKDILPNEDLIYFGDTAHLPYGDKSAEAIKSYSVKITEFLMTQHCKAIVIACNTASAVGFKAVQKTFKHPELVINVIDPVSERVALRKGIDKVGVIATKRTVSTKAYSKRLLKLKKELKVSELATPLLAPMIEEGFFNNKISQTIINSYLSKKPLKDIQALILGCTHYPLIESEIHNYYGKGVEIFDSAKIVAENLKEVLSKNKLLKSKGKGNYEFYVSDYTSSFEQTAKIFFKEKIKLNLYQLWK